MKQTEAKPISPQKKTFADAVNEVTNSANPKLNFRSLVNKEHVENSDCVLPLEQVIAAQNKFANSLVRFFCGKESGLLVSPELSYSEDGLSIIVTQLGKPIMLDAFTNAMCAEPWGRLGFARALIEVTAEKDLKQEVTMAIPIVDGEGHTMAKIDVAYEWKPASDGFTMVQNRKKKGKQVGNNQARPAEGFKVSKPSQVWNIKSTKKGSGTQKDDSSKLVNQNPFDVLNTVDNVKELGKTSGDKEAPKETKDKQTNLEYESEVEEMVVSENQLNVCVILESHVEINTLANVCSKVFPNWDWTSNAGLCNKGCRIIRGWNKDVVDVIVMHQTDQAIHAKVIHQDDQKIICCTFIYAGNDPRERRVLWADLKLHKRVVSGLPLVLLGDFNVALNMKDICMGSSSMNSAMCDFKDYVRSIEVMDIHSTGLHFTWNQKPRRRNGILKKLDRIMGNLDFVDTYQGRFLELLNTHWNASIVGHSMFQELDEVQKALDRNPSNSDIRGEEAVYVQAFDEAKIDEERFLRQIN
ncbi:putative reverse transcriptase domain-containing protein [Tanacetum coccineum]